MPIENNIGAENIEQSTSKILTISTQDNINTADSVTIEDTSIKSPSCDMSVEPYLLQMPEVLNPGQIIISLAAYNFNIKNRLNEVTALNIGHKINHIVNVMGRYGDLVVKMTQEELTTECCSRTLDSTIIIKPLDPYPTALDISLGLDIVQFIGHNLLMHKDFNKTLDGIGECRMRTDHDFFTLGHLHAAALYFRRCLPIVMDSLSNYSSRDYSDETRLIIIRCLIKLRQLNTSVNLCTNMFQENGINEYCPSQFILEFFHRQSIALKNK